MKSRFQERGQALIVVALAAVMLFAFTALAIDGSRAFEDRRHAQNAADTAALAGALSYSRSTDVNTSTTAAQDRATSNGYTGTGSNTVKVSVTDAPAGACPIHLAGKDVKVDITSTINTSIARVIGKNTMTSTVTATARTCAPYYGPPFDGNAIVSLAPTGIGYNGSGTPDWNIQGGGIFSNSADASSAICKGSASISVPSVAVVGSTNFNCGKGPGTLNIGPITTGAPQYTATDMASFFPRQPACNGTASVSGGQWHPQAGADGSRVTWTDGGVTDFAEGLYCVTNSPGPFHSQISGKWVTFYIMSPTFDMKLNGGGGFSNAFAPISGEYRGILIYMAPQFDASGNLVQTQNLEVLGNGNANVVGTIFAPSANVTMLGNSGSSAYNSQIIAYRVDSGGGAKINIKYNPTRNYNVNLPIKLTLLK